MTARPPRGTAPTRYAAGRLSGRGEQRAHCSFTSWTAVLYLAGRASWPAVGMALREPRLERDRRWGCCCSERRRSTWQHLLGAPRGSSRRPPPLTEPPGGGLVHGMRGDALLSCCLMVLRRVRLGRARSCWWPRFLSSASSSPLYAPAVVAAGPPSFAEVASGSWPHAHVLLGERRARAGLSLSGLAGTDLPRRAPPPQDPKRPVARAASTLPSLEALDRVNRGSSPWRRASRLLTLSLDDGDDLGPDSISGTPLERPLTTRRC